MKQYLSNMFSVMKNGLILKSWYVVHKWTRSGEKILKALWKEGFIRGYKIVDEDTTKLMIFFKYVDGRSAINSMKIISTPGRKIYCKLKQLWKIDSNRQVLFISTNRGIKSLIECKKLNLGGKVLLSVH